MILFALLTLSMLSGEIRELIYRAEVHGEIEPALAVLRKKLASVNMPEQRDEIVRAMAIIKHPRGPIALTRGARGLPEILAEPSAMIRSRGVPQLLVGGHWLEPGDWIEDYYVLRIETDRMETESLLGNKRPFVTRPLSEKPLPKGDFVIAREAPLRDLLSHAVAKMGFGFFIDPGIDQRVSGIYPLDNDWLAFVSAICEENSVTFTLRGENAIFQHLKTSSRPSLETFSARNEQAEELYGILQEIADRFEMELLFDDRLYGQVIYSKFEDQPWDQIVECLAITHGFSWTLLEEDEEKAKLVVQKQ